ncbi:MAG TPA: nucleotide disphospho-sugar-binding domain-containing protein [Longimicrobiales bacterium]
MRFLMCSFGNPGFLFPMLGLALELRRRGHEVAFVTGIEAGGVLQRLGVRRIPRGDGDGESFHVARWPSPIHTAIDVKHIEYALERFGPDALVTHSLCQAPIIVKERTGIAVGVMGFAAYLWPSAGGADGTVGPKLRRLQEWRAEDMLLQLNRARSLFRLKPRDLDLRDFPLLGDLFMVRSVPELEPTLPLLPEQVHVVGACLWEPPAGESDPWSEIRSRLTAPDAPILYAHQGRAFGRPDFWPLLTCALAGESLQVIASVGRMDGGPGDLPGNFFARDHVPQELVLPRAAAVVCAGHTSVVLGTLTHGLPGVVVPHGGETPDNADRLVAQGCAIRLDGAELGPDTLRDAVFEAMRSDAMRDNARRIQKAFERMSGFDTAATLVEALGTTGERVPRA